MATPSEERSLDRAEQDLTHIGQLLDSDAYQRYFVRRINERIEAIRAKIADDDTLTDAETRLLRNSVKELREVLRMPLQDRGAHQSTLAAFRNPPAGPSRG